MARKQKRRASRSRSTPDTLTSEAIERKAREDLAGGRHRDAIDGFKQLLKLEPHPAWRSALADAYAGRARELAAKGMRKEALVIWENRAGLGDDFGLEPEHAALLLQLGRLESVLALFSGKGAAVSAALDPLRPYLAAGVLSGNDMIVERLPADDPVVLHAAPARSCLAAYCTGDDLALRTALAEIPFRSPYRDWVQILKALQRLPERQEEAADLLARVGEDSAFGQLRRAVELSLEPEAAFLAAISGCGAAITGFSCALRGWTPERISLWQELDRLGATPRPETLLRFMYRHSDALGADWVRRRGLRLLIAGYPASLKWLRSVGASRPSAEEAILLSAWDAERRENLWDEREQWEALARRLIRETAGVEQDLERKLRIALAFRRCDRVANVLPTVEPSDDPDDLGPLVAGQLEESLRWDPDDRDTYLRLIGYYRRGKRLKDVRRLLGRVAERCPQDMQVLGAALDVALDAGSFKKAAGLAREMLALDPINTNVRERLVEAHLAHARKQVLKGRPDLARRELANVGEWARSGHARDQLDLTAGLIALIEDAETGAPALRDLVGRLGGGLTGQLALALTAEALRLSPQKLLKAAGLGKPATAGREDLLATLARLRAHLDGGGRIGGEIDAYLAKPLADAPWASLSRGETEAACDTLRRCGLHKVRLGLARAALKRWKGDPVFEVHTFEAKYPKGFNARSYDDLDRLDLALERARAEGDTRTAVRIEKILNDADPFPFGPMPIASPPGADGFASALDAKVLSMLIGILGLDKVLSMLGLPADMKRELKGLARGFGEQEIAERLTSFLGKIDEIADTEGAPPIPQPPPRKPAPREKPARTHATDPDRDDEPPDQLDLFS